MVSVNPGAMAGKPAAVGRFVELAKQWRCLQGSCARLLWEEMRRRRFSSAEDDAIVEFRDEMEAVFGTPLTSGSQDVGRKSGAAAEPASESGFSHVDASGKAAMVDVSGKAESTRVAVASGKVMLGLRAFSLVAANQIDKGDVLSVAKIAGIGGAKQTSALIPLCHNIVLGKVDVTLSLDENSHAVVIRAEASALGPTGVEMEALTAVCVAGLTVYDMCKAVSKDIQVCRVQLESKTGGKSGNWQRGDGK